MDEITAYGSYREYKAKLDTELQKSTEGFVKIGYLLKLARDTDILKESGYANVNDFARAEYSIDKTLVSRFININDRFSEGGNSPQLKEQYRGFGYAKLAIMLQLPDAVNEELSPAFSKSEVQAVKEEYDEEQKKTDLEVLMEGSPEGQQAEENNLVKAVRQLGRDNPELYIYIHGAMQEGTQESLQETLAPAGESIYSVRLQGVGRLMLSVKGLDHDITLTNIRTNEKESYSWKQMGQALAQVIDLYAYARESWETEYGEPFPVKEKPEKEKVAPVQQQKETKKQTPKKQTRVIKAKPEPPKPINTQWEGDSKPNTKEESAVMESGSTSGGQQEIIENVTETAEIVNEMPLTADKGPGERNETQRNGDAAPTEGNAVPSDENMNREGAGKYRIYMAMVKANMEKIQTRLDNRELKRAREYMEETMGLLDTLIGMENEYREETKMQMNNEEIVRRYREAKDKAKQRNRS